MPTAVFAAVLVFCTTNVYAKRLPFCVEINNNLKNSSKLNVIDNIIFSVTQTRVIIEESICTKVKSDISDLESSYGKTKHLSLSDGDDEVFDLPYYFCIMVEKFFEHGNRTSVAAFGRFTLEKSRTLSSSWMCGKSEEGKKYLLNMYGNGTQ